MSAHDHLQPMQFPRSGEVSFHHQETPARHVLSAKVKSGEVVGALLWGKDSSHPVNREDKLSTGEITNVKVHEEHRNQGIATHMFNLSQQFDPPARHSGRRTEAGEGWARKVGGPLPKRTGDS